MPARSTSIVATLLLVTGASATCEPTAATCEFTLVLSKQLTGWAGWTKFYTSNGSHIDKYGTPLADQSLGIGVDGVDTSRWVLVANGTLPGPAIEVYKGQEVVVNVVNHDHTETSSVHWHGIYQRGTPWMDGVGRLTQCSILPGQTYTYRFTAHPVGTHWYHSHVGEQRSQGLYGALVVREPTQDPSTEHVILMEDYDGTAGTTRTQTSMKTFSGQGLSSWEEQSTSTILNGKGRAYNEATGAYNEAPLSVFNCTSGDTYRLRFIHAGHLFPFRVSVEGHTMTLVASDGAELEPTVIESFIATPGERFDVEVACDQPTGNYWIHAESMVDNDVYRHHDGLAILRYAGANKEDPSAETVDYVHPCTSEAPCHVANCPFPVFPASEFSVCLQFAEDLKRRMLTTEEASGSSAGYNDPAPAYNGGINFSQHWLNWGFTHDDASVAGRSMKGGAALPDGSVLTQPEYRSWLSECTPADNPECGDNLSCKCPLTLFPRQGETVEMVLMNLGSGSGWAHPIHIHGYHFHVLKISHSPWNATSGTPLTTVGTYWSMVALDNPEVTCLGNNSVETWDGLDFCNAARFTDPTWVGDDVPGLELEKAPLKDTLNIPRGGYAIVRIVADNPGIWFMHCHVEIHSTKGMSMVIAQLDGLDDLIAEGLPSGGDGNGQICGTHALEAHDTRLAAAVQKAAAEALAESSPPAPCVDDAACPSGSSCKCVVSSGRRQRHLLFASTPAPCSATEECYCLP